MFEMPKVLVAKFSVEDVITVSGGYVPGDNETPTVPTSGMED